MPHDPKTTDPMWEPVGGPDSFVPRLPAVDPTDPSAGLVQQLLGNLSLPQAPTPPSPTRGQQFLGGLGDALFNAASVLSGGQPRQGPYAQRQAQLQDQFRVDSLNAAAERRDLENRIKIGQFEEERRIRARQGELQRVAQQNEETERRDMDNKLRFSLIERAIDRGLPVSPEMSTEELLATIGDSDPQAAAMDILGSIQPGFEVKSFQLTQGKDGKQRISSVQVGRKSEKGARAIPKEQIETAIKLGAMGFINPGVAIAGDPDDALFLDAVAAGAFDDKLGQDARFSYKDIRDSLRSGDVSMFPDEPALDTQLAVVADEMMSVSQQRDGGKAADLWDRMVHGATDEVVAGNLTQDQADRFLFEVRRQIQIAFPTIALDAPQPAPVPVPEVQDEPEKEAKKPKVVGGKRVAEAPLDTLTQEELELKRLQRKVQFGGSK